MAISWRPAATSDLLLLVALHLIFTVTSDGSRLLSFESASFLPIYHNSITNPSWYQGLCLLCCAVYQHPGGEERASTETKITKKFPPPNSRFKWPNDRRLLLVVVQVKAQGLTTYPLELILASFEEPSCPALSTGAWRDLEGDGKNHLFEGYWLKLL